MPRPVRPVRPVKPVSSNPPPKKTVGKVSAQSQRSVFLIMLGLPLFLITSVVLYRRVFEGQDKRIQLGEYTPDGGLRVFSQEEKEKKDSNSWLTRIFGKDK